VTAGTLFEKTRTPLRVWLAGALHLACAPTSKSNSAFLIEH
jgi:hypothetical protein